MKPFSERIAVNPNPGENGEMTVLFSGVSQTKPDHRLGPQVLDYALVHVVEEGKGYFRCGETEYELGPGDSFFILPGVIHSYRSDSETPWKYRWIAFRGPALPGWLRRAGISPARPVIRQKDEAPLAPLASAESAFRRGGAAADLEAEGWLRLAFASWAEANGENRPSADGVGKSGVQAREAERAALWLQAQLGQPITIERMAKELGYHRTHLSKLFRQQFGMPPVRYLQKLRLERSRALLREPLTVEEVAAAVGYADPLYFSKSFKRQYGVTPTDYRKGKA
ncbi:AraC family transcriptional regulator [Cohnella algarum]|uniref:AraC family transcriptional regulator n=1 Tax=Cohnella algarum TaxID=2044859 RepID=UPI00196895C4|nr:AraC family transcriptional regulator [Cohnella algarum]MBN2984480.1 AraC family transcriptional regulator [Cohnella algarum]